MFAMVRFFRPGPVGARGRAFVAFASVLALAACGGSTTTGPSAHPSAPPAGTASTASTAAPADHFPQGWVDQDVSFVVDGLTIHATYRHPVSAAKAPAALLIAGSGAPDRNGDSPGFPENSLRLLANRLAIAGVATLRYDKLGSGQTGLGPFATKLPSLRVSTYAREAATALRYLAAEPRSDPAQLSVFGHSEGGFYALLLATGGAGTVPHIARLGLIEPLSRRNFDVLDEQLSGQIQQDVSAGKLTAAAGKIEQQQIEAAIGAARAGRTPGPIPARAVDFFSANNLGYDTDIDRYDPAVLGARLPAGTRVLLTCSTNDVQVLCPDVDHLDAGLKQGKATVDYVQLHGMDHGLKADTSPASANDTANLPMAPALAAAIAQFLRR
jgi:acetyl esterase/lipase